MADEFGDSPSSAPGDRRSTTSKQPMNNQIELIEPQSQLTDPQSEITDPPSAPAEGTEASASQSPAPRKTPKPRKKQPSVFHLSADLLLREADLILGTARRYSFDMARRLGPGALSEADRKRSELGTKTRAVLSGGSSTLQKSRLEMIEFFNHAKATARLAFKGQLEKLRTEFKVNAPSFSTLSNEIERASVACASCALPGNAEALAAKGWIGEDTAAFSALIEVVTKEQEKHDRYSESLLELRQAIYALSTSLYEDLRTIQNAASIQWPERGKNSQNVRTKFRLDAFPPKKRAAAGEAKTPAV